MLQVLFNIPVLKNVFPPDGIPIYGFGAMLFLAFLSVWVWGTYRARRIGMNAVAFQDFMIWVFISGLLGARLLYMTQYSEQFGSSVWGIISSFPKIWEGGIILLGSVPTGIIGYALFYYLVMRKLNVSGWQLADVVAPLLALGLALGRIGCLLNGCCWGQTVCEQCEPVPLGAIHFPLLPSPAGRQVVYEQGLQTTTGFALRPREGLVGFQDDPRSVVLAIEPDSAVAKTGLKPGDRIVKVNGRPNTVVVEIEGPEEQLQKAVKEMQAAGGRVKSTSADRAGVEFDSLAAYHQGQAAARAATAGLRYTPADHLDELIRTWPRGKGTLELSVERDGNTIDLKPFKPETVGLYPTQFYETVSMCLLIFLLLSYYPFRHHDGEVMVLLMVGYSIHRFINESLRIEPTVGMGLTLSQWGSVLIFVAAVAMELYLLRVMPSRWKLPASAGPVAKPGEPPATTPTQVVPTQTTV